jgi:hypothetical protein
MIAAGPAQGERITNAAQGRPKQVQPPRGAESHTQWANVGVHIS